MSASTSTQLAVHVRAVTKTFGTGEAAVPALKGVDFDARQGELLMIVGPSGCGNTAARARRDRHSGASFGGAVNSAAAHHAWLGAGSAGGSGAYRRFAAAAA